MAIQHWYRSLSLEPTDRSEFFWLPASGISRSEVLLHDYRARRPVSSAMREQWDALGIRVLGHGPGVPRWVPTWRLAPILALVLGRFGLAVFVCLVRGQGMSVFVPLELLALSIEYASWYDFYAANRVRLAVGTINLRVAQLLALDALDGVSAAYQYSVSNLITPTWFTASGADVQFVFSPFFERHWCHDAWLADRVVPVGFVYDGAIASIRARGRAAALRQTLQDRGVQWVLGFFDENSLPRWDCYVSDADAAQEYAVLLQWLLEDPTLGIVCKPKKFTDLFQRIASVRPLIDQAIQTGRCVFLASDTVVGSIYPAEAALSADLCIGNLDGISAALEARLAGVPTVLVDTTGFSQHPFYAWGRDRVVFDSWASLRQAVERYRSDPAASPGFGDWSPGLDDLDPFRDGRATERLGGYLGAIAEALRRGASKREALEAAARQHAARWGALPQPSQMLPVGEGVAVP